MNYFILLIIFFFSPILHAFSPQFEGKAAQALERITQQHPGILMIKDLSTSQEWVAGDSAFLEKKFLPGSLMKLITAKLAVDQKLNPSFKCVGRSRIGPHKFYCWTRKGHGDLNLVSALAKSCNLYFLKLLSQLSFKDWKANFEQYFSSGLPSMDSNALQYYYLSLGDDAALKLSPRELFSFWQKYLKDIQTAPYADILQALKRSSEEGTLKRLRFKIIGKSGTADSLKKSYKTDAWLLGAYPQENPRYVFLVFFREAYGFREPVDLMNEVLGML
ncbi:MAG: hypothetical protein HQM15_09880 [Deltaproteobacteria bacterium]|nr:hypothetical protein [Deltaproteobacteria bacterium]